MIIVIILLLLPIIGFLIYKETRKNVKSSTKIVEFIIIAFFVASVALFAFGWMLNSADYYKPIDIVDEGYTPFSSKHVLTLIVFFVLAVFSVIKLWLKGRNLPPLLFVIYIIFIVIGLPISFVILLQISSNTVQSDVGLLFSLLPVTYIFTGIIVLIKVISDEASQASTRVYKNIFLQFLNQKMAKVETQPLWIFALLIPLFIIIVAVLMLFGQEANSITKVFTETTTWHFSQKTHPPFLDHKGHYLCTVAACGDPKIVKPIRLGKRHGHEIIINRQLQIANAFEELIQENIPALHRIIRRFYDKYGYPLSKKITSSKASNLVYFLMKPLEYIFLVVVYLCCLRPEEKIAKQYSL